MLRQVEEDYFRRAEWRGSLEKMRKGCKGELEKEEEEEEVRFLARFLVHWWWAFWLFEGPRSTV